MHTHSTMNLLGLPDYYLLNMKESDTAITLFVESKTTGVTCSQCGNLATVIYDHRKPRRVGVETIRGKAVYIIVRPKRFRCTCGSVTQEVLPSIAPYAHQVDEFAQKLRDRSLRHPMSEVASEENVPYSTMRARQAEAIDTMDYPDIDWKNIKRIGIDEFSNKKRHQYYLIITDLDRKEAIAILPNRTKLELKCFLAQLKEVITIEAFAIDMWAAYATAVKEIFPNAKPVVDRFHVVKYAIDALCKVRRELQKTLENKDERTQVWKIRNVLCANRQDLDDETRQELDKTLEVYPKLKAAYWLKERFRQWYEYAGTRAEEGFCKWVNQVKKLGHQAFLDVVETIKRWKEGIFNYFLIGITNGPTKGINNKIKAIKRACYGRLSFRTLRARILFSFRDPVRVN